MVFVGYESGSKAYRVYDPSTRCVHISRDIVFDEAVACAWSAADPAEPNDFIIEEVDQQDPSVIITSRTTTEVSLASSSGSPGSIGRGVPRSIGRGRVLSFGRAHGWFTGDPQHSTSTQLLGTSSSGVRISTRSRDGGLSRR